MPEARLDYQKISHRAHPGFLVEAPSLERLYINAALALTDLLVDLRTIGDEERHTVVIEADDRETLMERWLEEILAHFHAGKFLCRRVVFEKFDGRTIRATLRGATHDPLRHGHVSDIKGVQEGMEMGETFDSQPSFFVKVFLEYR